MIQFKAIKYTNNIRVVAFFYVSEKINDAIIEFLWEEEEMIIRNDIYYFKIITKKSTKREREGKR